MTSFKIELVITDNRFINPDDLGSNTTRRTIMTGEAANDVAALSAAEMVCGTLDSGFVKNSTGRKYRTWVRCHSLFSAYKYSSTLVVTFRSLL